MLHELIYSIVKWYFPLVLEYGYPGIAGMMALESTVVPIPSEVIIPPAAWWASQGKLSAIGVILAGTIGSVVGAWLMYLASRHIGRPLLLRYGKYVLIKPEKIEAAERFLARYHTGGIFFARLLPVVRHLIGIPAGIIRIPLGTYLTMTAIGSASWCTVLTWFGQRVLGKEPNLINDPEALTRTLKHESMTIVIGVVVLTLLYIAVVWMTRKDDKKAV